jgi:hypothetical protein
MRHDGFVRTVGRARSVRLLAVAALAVTGVIAQPAASAQTAGPAGALARVGPLFFPSALGLGPQLQLPHYCTASVVHSSGHDLLLTAAHCVLGTGLETEFAPGYRNGVSPYGDWTVTAAYLDPHWLANQDPRYDFAVLAVAAQGARNVEDLTGAPALGSAPATGASVTVAGYVLGTGGVPTVCTARAYYTSGYPSFNCGGFSNGTSGGRWLAGGRLVGVIGGLQGGGCSASTSYSAPFGAVVAALLARAERRGAGDLAPVSLPLGC